MLEPACLADGLTNALGCESALVCASTLGKVSATQCACATLLPCTNSHLQCAIMG